VYGAFTLYGETFQKASTSDNTSILRSYNPKATEITLVWAVPSSLAATMGITIVLFSSRYLDVSVPWVCPLTGNTSSTYWVSPFGNLRFNWPFAPYRSLSQLTTSFIASESQGIPHILLLTFINYSGIIYFSCNSSMYQHVNELFAVLLLQCGE
jgi:hypothetical protein